MAGIVSKTVEKQKRLLLYLSIMMKFQKYYQMAISSQSGDFYPFLAMLAKDVFGVPSSSAPVERLFSIAGKVFTPERCRLTDKRFEQLMFIRCNHAHTSQ